MSPILLVFRQRVTTGEIDELLNSIGVYATSREGQVSLCDFGKRSGVILKFPALYILEKKLLLLKCSFPIF